MSASPRLPKKSQTDRRPLSAPMILVFTALDTTWRIFIPTLGGTFLGLGIDAWLGVAPIGLIVCLIIGAGLSFLLIARQLSNVRK